MPNNTLMIGHSLVGTTMPQMLSSLLAARTPGTRADYQVINGAPLIWNWNHGFEAQGVNATAVLPSGEYSTLILTEAVPLAGHIQWNNTYGVTQNYYNLAMAGNPNTQVMIYETWGEFTTDAAWRAALNTDHALWRGIVNNLNANKAPNQPAATLLPAGQAMAELYDTIALGQGVGLTSIHQIFVDNIHPSVAGFYFLTMVQYAAITHSSPVGLTSAVTNIYGQRYTGWTPEQANLFQHIAWEEVAPAGPNAPILRRGTSANETLSGGIGDDRIYGGDGRNLLQGGAGSDLITGGQHQDRIYGDAGNDWLTGNAGNDLLYGGADSDRLFGGIGNDQLSGGTGRDILHGGSGADAFIYNKSDAADSITDFTLAANDRLHLNHNLWTGTLTAAQVVQQFARVTTAGVVFDFGAGDRLTLTNLHSLTGLESHLLLV